MNLFWKGKKVIITGGAGFVGSFVTEKLVRLGASVTVMGRSDKPRFLPRECRYFRGDCTDKTIAVKACRKQDIVLNLAAKVAGIGYNRSHQAEMFRENIAVPLSMLEAARICGNDRFLTVSSACVYPHDAVIPTPETEGSRDEPESTNGGYAWAKRMSETISGYFAREYGMKIGIVRPYNAYGPRDHFGNDSHVIPDLIRRVIAGEDPLLVWGSGKQTRSFLYVQDLAEGMIAAIEKYPVPDPVNLGSDEEVSVKDLVNMIMEISGSKAKVIYDKTKPDGSPRRKSDNTKAKKLLEFRAKTSLQEGLDNTIKWYLSNIK
jgi:GDP-L-fucose synthase